MEGVELHPKKTRDALVVEVNLEDETSQDEVSVVRIIYPHGDKSHGVNDHLEGVGTTRSLRD